MAIVAEVDGEEGTVLKKVRLATRGLVAGREVVGTSNHPPVRMTYHQRQSTCEPAHSSARLGSIPEAYSPWRGPRAGRRRPARFWGPASADLRVPELTQMCSTITQATLLL